MLRPILRRRWPARQPRLLALAIFTTILAIGACASAPRSEGREVERTVLTVRNDNYLDHTIYLINGSERVRIGIARGLATTRFTIPPHYVFGPTALQFLADPIGARISPVSERVNVSPGDEIEIIIPSR